jgi:cytochrome P450
MADVVDITRFDLQNPHVQADPYPYYPPLREHHPVLQTEFFGQPCWVLSRRADVSAVLMDTKTYSSRTTPIDLLLFSDPPRHAELRKMVAERFTRTAVAAQSEQIVAATEQIFENCLEMARCDAIDDFASPLTIRMMGILLGISVEEVDNVRGWTQLLADGTQARRIGTVPRPEVTAAEQDMSRFIIRIVNDRAYQPGSALELLGQRFRDGDLTPDQLVQFATLLFVAGHSTTTNLIGNALYVLAHRPDDLARMREDEPYIERFIEEVLRTRPSFHRILRITTRDVELHGVDIPAGSIVRLLLASANLDPATSESGDRFDPEAKARMHLSFGQGIHSCLGSWLARLESRTALGVIADKAAALMLAPDQPPTPFTGGTFNEFGFEHLPITVTRR